ncbi:hypothetical protein [Companilactobacillus farciminis]|uniref:hypothetical protein n=1 Tax=Companilactobacillus farciminis TaxID=1612 RepID=UPI00241F5B48|nr:hypothetical protein [Companilactobacillus farciminis]
MYNVSKDLLGNKFKRIALILGWNFLSVLAVITIDYLKIIFNPSYKTILLIALSAGFYLWSVVSLIKFSRQVLNNNKYRLIPLSDKKLFFSDFLTSLVAYITYCLVSGGMLLVSLYYYMGKTSFLRVIIDGNTQSELLLKDLAIFFLGTVLILVGSTLIHLTMGCLESIFPFKNQKAFKIMFNCFMVAITAGISYLSLIEMSAVSMYRFIKVPTNLFTNLCLVEGFIVIAIVLIDLYLLENLSETTRS